VTLEHFLLEHNRDLSARKRHDSSPLLRVPENTFNEAINGLLKTDSALDGVFHVGNSLHALVLYRIGWRDKIESVLRENLAVANTIELHTKCCAHERYFLAGKLHFNSYSHSFENREKVLRGGGLQH